MRLLHLTDPHLSHLNDVKVTSLRGKRWSGYASWYKNRQKKYLPSVLEHLCASVKKEGADQILLTGDLLQIGLETEVEQATRWLRNLGPAGQVMLVPGNHDIYAKGSAVTTYQAWPEYLFQSDHPGAGSESTPFPVLRKVGKLSLIGLSTAVVTPVFMAGGELGAAQLERLSGLLEQAAREGQLTCLLIHHPPLPGMTNWRKALKDAAALEAVLKKHPPGLVFHGHLHHNREYLWGDSRIYCTAAASSVSDASYRVIDIDDLGDRWALRMTLKSVFVDQAGELEFAVVDEQSWQISKSNGRQSA